MYCPRCGQENDDQAQFCRSCGAALQEPVQKRGIERWVTDTKILGDIGLIAGILALVGVFTPWITDAPGDSISAWDRMIGRPTAVYEVWAGLAFGAALILLVGALCAVATPKAKAPWVILHVGGALAIAGFAAAVSYIREGHSGYGYGLFLTLVGGILGLIGILGLRGTSSASLPKSAKRDSQFSRSSGAALQEPVQERGIQRWVTDRRMLGRVGLIAGILALVGVFTPWSTPNLSAWDAMTGLQVGDNAPLYLVWAGLALGAALILLVGAVSAVAAPRAKAPWVILHVGGALVIAGFASGLSDIREDGVSSGVFTGYGYGLYLTLFGGILGLTGIWGLRGSSSVFLAKSAKQDSQLSRSSGVALQEPLQGRGIQRWVTDRKVLGRVGLIAGVLALVGVFNPWATGSGWRETLNISAWDSITMSTAVGPQIPRGVWACLALAGAVLVLVGALSALAAPKAKVPWAILGVGGVLSIAGCAWGLFFITTGTLLGYHLGGGYGLYLTLVGGVLGLAGILGLRRSSRFHDRLGIESK